MKKFLTIGIVTTFILVISATLRNNEPKKTISAWTDGPELHYIVTIY